MEKIKPKLLFFASGSADGGGSGFQECVEFSRTDPPVLDAEIIGVVSNHQWGGVRRKADRLGIPFYYWNGPFEAEGYRRIFKDFRADYVMLSGWLKLVRGLEPETTINIHPGPLPVFGGPGLYGHHVHEAVMKAYREGSISQSAVTMHFVTEQYDRGPIILQFPVFIRGDDTPESLATRVNEKERVLQSIYLNRVIHGGIYYRDGKVLFCY
jgi:folate-dependent phosphoribosylglycinamide formyltransferase PurN